MCDSGFGVVRRSNSWPTSRRSAKASHGPYRHTYDMRSLAYWGDLAYVAADSISKGLTLGVPSWAGPAVFGSRLLSRGLLACYCWRSAKNGPLDFPIRSVYQAKRAFGFLLALAGEMIRRE